MEEGHPPLATCIEGPCGASACATHASCLLVSIAAVLSLCDALPVVHTVPPSSKRPSKQGAGLPCLLYLPQKLHVLQLGDVDVSLCVLVLLNMLAYSTNAAGLSPSRYVQTVEPECLWY